METTVTDDVILSLVARCGVIPGKKVFQKLCYFLQEAEGVRMGLRFRMKHYGPFSEELDERLEDLGERGLVSIQDCGDEGFKIEPSPRSSEVDIATTASEQIEELLSKMGGEIGRGLTLELLATLHFLTESQGYEGGDADKDELIRRVQAWKGKTKFKEYFIRRNIEKLEELGYLSTT